MKEFIKKYPALIVFIGVAIIITLIFVLYEVVYHGQNRSQQKAYEELGKSAWMTELGSEQETDTTDPERIKNEEAMKTFLESTDDPDFFKKKLAERPNFDKLWNLNPDVIGYLQIPDSNIDYPVLQSLERRDYYLKRNIDGSTGFPGCIFAENINSGDFSDAVTILYGHNMQNGTMFGQLKKYFEEDFREEHKYIFVYQPDCVSLYEVVVVSPYSEEHLLVDDFIKNGNSFMFSGVKRDDQVRVINHLKEFNSKLAYFAEGEITEEDKLLVLSTCSGARARNIVAAKKLFTHWY